MKGKPVVGIIMGSDSDLKVMQAAADILKSFQIEYEVSIVSAHRTPERMFDYGKNARGRGLKVIIAGAGGAAHLPGMIAAVTTLRLLVSPSIIQLHDGWIPFFPSCKCPMSSCGHCCAQCAKNAESLLRRSLDLRRSGIVKAEEYKNKIKLEVEEKARKVEGENL